MKIIPVVAVLALALASGVVAQAASDGSGGDAVNGAALAEAGHYAQDAARSTVVATGPKIGFVIDLPFGADPPAGVSGSRLPDGSTMLLLDRNDGR